MLCSCCLPTIWATSENCRQTKCGEHARKTFRPSKILELHIFQIEQISLKKERHISRHSPLPSLVAIECVLACTPMLITDFGTSKGRHTNPDKLAFLPRTPTCKRLLQFTVHANKTKPYSSTHALSHQKHRRAASPENASFFETLAFRHVCLKWPGDLQRESIRRKKHLFS